MKTCTYCRESLPLHAFAPDRRASDARASRCRPCRKLRRLEMIAQSPPCRVGGCDLNAAGRGWCLRHYVRWQRFGDPIADVTRGLPRTPVIDRVLDKCHEDADGCWIFPVSAKGNGYGNIGSGGQFGRTVQTHRVTYEFFIADIPAGLQLDHLCRKPACCNPWHLEPVTGAINTARKPRFVDLPITPEGVVEDLCLKPTGCARCAAPLPKGRRRWCSDDCRMTWYRNHIWTFARDACMKRQDHHCIGCGQPATEVDHIIERRGVPIHSHTCLHHQENLRALCHDCHVNRATRLDGQGEAALPDWGVLLRLEDFTKLSRAAGYGDTDPDDTIRTQPEEKP